jgi:ubiquinone/menaquinone biosynthesis C-methylase UbiE
MLPSLSATFDRVVYPAQQRGLALSLGVGGRLVSTLLAPTAPLPSAGSVRELRRRFDALIEEDLANVERGAYPRELLYQFPLVEYLARLPEALSDVPRFFWRSYRGNFADVPVRGGEERYPDYYLRTFHWQTDGWLSSRSARLYDASVEFLFGGTADVMRRMAIPPVTAMQDAAARRRRRGAALRILDIGCGTGRFLRQLGRALPDARLYGLDLSRHYLAEARRHFAPSQDVSFVVENAETLPFAAGYFDVVTSVFMFHELPKPVRRRVTREVRRVLAPGGRFVICDSAQLGDSREVADVLLSFPKSYHEPFYRGYLSDDLANVMRDGGLVVKESRAHLVSKVVVGEKRRSGRGGDAA